MLKQAFLFFIFAAFGSLFGPTEWVRVETGSAELRFPARPRLDSMVVNTELGPVKAYTFILEDRTVDASNLAYSFSETLYTGNMYRTDKGRFTKRMLSGAVDGAVRDGSGTLISQKDISLQGYPGKEIRISKHNGAVIETYRLFRKLNQLVIMGTISNQGKEINADAEQFFSSLRFKTDNIGGVRSHSSQGWLKD